MPTKETAVDQILPAEVLYQRSVPQLVLDWTQQLVAYLQADYDRGSTSGRYKFEIQTGRKYHKINVKNGGVHAFVDKQTGQVYKPASWKSPAKHVRYDLRLIKDREYLCAHADWAGSYLYLRG